MAWLGVLIFIFFLIINVVAFLLRKNQKVCYAIVYTIAIYLLIFKVIEYVCYQIQGLHIKIPVEFSALSYFILAITVLTRKEKLEQFGAFVALLAGLMFSISFWVSPDSFVSSIDSMFLFVCSIINHHLLYFASILLIFNVRRYNYKYCWIQLIGVGVMVGYSWLIHLFTNYSDIYKKPIIIQICDGTILDWLGAKNIPPWGYALYIALAVVALFGILAGFYVLNNVFANKRKKQGLIENYMPKKFVEIYKRESK